MNLSSKSKIEKAKIALKQKQKLSQKPVEKVCSTRLPIDEFEALEKEIKELGYKNMSQYFREILLARKREYSLSELEQYKIFLIGKISNNINQVAKIMNQDIKKNGEVDYKKTALNFEKMLEQFYKLIG